MTDTDTDAEHNITRGFVSTLPQFHALIDAAYERGKREGLEQAGCAFVDVGGAMEPRATCAEVWPGQDAGWCNVCRMLSADDEAMVYAQGAVDAEDRLITQEKVRERRSKLTLALCLYGAEMRAAGLRTAWGGTGKDTYGAMLQRTVAALAEAEQQIAALKGERET